MKRGIILVGAGNWGQSWLQFIHESEGWELAALVSRGGENLQKAREKWNIPAGRCFPTLAGALKGPGDVVLITAPHDLHVPMALQALEAGRHALVEKPMSDDFEAARRLVKASERSKGGVWVAQNFRNRAGLWQLRQSLAAGALGKLLAIRLTFRRGGPKKPAPWPQEWRRRQWSFLMTEIIIHHFDMCRFVTGQDAEWVGAYGWNLPWGGCEGPECATAVAGLKDGTVFDYRGGMRVLCGPMTKFEGDWLIETDRGAASWGGDDARWELGKDETAKGPTGGLIDAPGFPGFDRAGVLNDLTEALEGRRPASLPTAAENLPSLAMVFAAVRSIKEGRRVDLKEILG